MYLLGGSFFLFSYHAIVMAEESFLKDKFGEEFDRYCSYVSRWGINLSTIRKTLASMEFNWRRVLSKDNTTMLTWILTIILLLTVDHFDMYGLVFNKKFLLEISLALVTALSAFCVVRIMKKNGVLSE